MTNRVLAPWPLRAAKNRSDCRGEVERRLRCEVELPQFENSSCSSRRASSDGRSHPQFAKERGRGGGPLCLRALPDHVQIELFLIMSDFRKAKATDRRAANTHFREASEFRPKFRAALITNEDATRSARERREHVMLRWNGALGYVKQPERSWTPPSFCGHIQLAATMMRWEHGP
jgi:hypothetical protein